MIGSMNRHDVKKWRYGGPCSECEKTTDWTCGECKMYANNRVWLCPDRACRTAHETKCCIAVAAN